VALTVLCLPARAGELQEATPALNTSAAALWPVDTELRDALTAAVIQLGEPAANGLEALLPARTILDRAEWTDNRVRIDLTFPEGEMEPELSPLAVEEGVRRLAAVIQPDLDFGGVIVRARVGSDGAYRLLEDFVPAAGPGAYPLRQEEAVVPPPSGIEESPDDLRAGPVANAGHQPTGALSGVTVFTSGGHGWTAGSSSWYLQRPLLLDMIEDYGNLEQLNYFVAYCFNAGATVVPFRPVGYQTTEIVLDQDDPEVTYTGSWSNSTYSVYYENGRTTSGVSYRFAPVNATETATARYTPDIPSADFYPVYTWVTDSDNRTTQLYRIVHSGGTTEVVVDHRLVGRGWVWLGNYYFEAGTGGYVEISNESDAGSNVIADAIRFGDGMGDVVGAGPGTISGYPRDEECQRYWAESETDLNANGLPSSIYDCCSTDGDDNVGTGARWAREMNNETVNSDRWRRVYLEFHTNAAGCSGGPPCSAKGTVALVTGAATDYQVEYATILGDEIEQDMQILDSGFEYLWGSRSNPYYGSFGAISTTNNGNEFDATILEVAFHDNVEDAANLLNPEVRNAVARSSVHGIVKFLNSLPDSTIPLSFLPMPPQNVRALHNGTGGVVIAWDPPLTGEAYGDAADGYRVYRSTNGYGFDGGLDVGNVIATTLLDVPAETTTYFRVAAYNTGGESMPTETVAVRRADSGLARFLIVNGFDRVSRQQDPAQYLSGVGTQLRPILRKVNSFDYVVQHAEALAAVDATFDTASNENVIDNDISLESYDAVVWISGEESSADHTFDATEQSRITAFLNAGGNLFVSGSEIAYDLDYLGNGASFYNNELKADYVSNDANTYNVNTVGGSIFDGISPFSFDDGDLFYDVDYPDRINTFGGSTAALTYSGGAGGTAGVTYNGEFKVVNFGFPFETITVPARRNEIMAAIVAFFDLGSNGPGPVEVIVEARDPGGALTPPPTYVEIGDWNDNDTVKSEAPGLYGFGSRYTPYVIPNPGTDNATFVPNLLAAGKYEVFVTWGNEANCYNARFTVQHYHGQTEELRHQLPDTMGHFSNADTWISLGEYWFEAGQAVETASVNVSEETITGQPTGTYPARMYADAAKWTPIRGWPDGDVTGDGQVTLSDFATFPDCLSGPGGGYNQPDCEDFDFDVDGDVDLDDFRSFQEVFAGA
jgi:hypothetical protein